MSKPEIFKTPIPKATVRRLADESFGDMVKFVVDLKRQVICVGGGLHADEEAILIDDGSVQSDLWGANYYLELEGEERFEYQSMINIRPAQNNRKQQIESPDIRSQVRRLGEFFFESQP